MRRSLLMTPSCTSTLSARGHCTERLDDVRRPALAHWRWLVAMGDRAARAGCFHRWRSLIVPDGVRRRKKVQDRNQSGKPPGFDERWVPWDRADAPNVWPGCGAPHRGAVPPAAAASGSWIRLSIPSVRSLSCCSTAGLMGLPAQLVAFLPARGPPEILLP